MKVFIENEAGTKLKNLFDEKKLAFKKTIKVSKAYPYPYGFILDTTAEDGDNVDVFVLTNKTLNKGEIVEVEVIGLMEQFEKSWDTDKDIEEADHNILAKLKQDNSITLNRAVKEELIDFVLHVFDNIRDNKTRVGEFKNKEAAMQYIQSNKD